MAKKEKLTYEAYIATQKIELEERLETTWVADFETTTQPSFEKEGHVRVYAWCLVSLKDDTLYRGTDIQSFINQIMSMGKDKLTTIFFHNLAFDLAFLEIELQRQGYMWAQIEKNSKSIPAYTYSTLRSRMGAVYSATIVTPMGELIELYDSAKIYPISVDALGKAVGIKKLKDTYDYDKYREVGYELTEEEWEYVIHDVLIVKEALIKNFEKYPYFKITRSSLAYERMKRTFIEHYYNGISNVALDWQKEWNKLFPPTEVKEWRELHNAYAGGIVYVNNDLKGKTLNKKGQTYDVNSEYPGAMLTKTFPYGNTVYFDGAYNTNGKGKEVSYKNMRQEDKTYIKVRMEREVNLADYPLYIQKFECAFRLKTGCIPTLPKKLSIRNKAIETHEDLIVPILQLCDVDLKHFIRNYEIVGEVKFHGGYAFKAVDAPFADFINLCANEKIEAEKSGNKMLRLMSKLDMNGCYGKFAQNIQQDSKASYIDDENVLKFEEVLAEPEEQNFLPMAIWITAWARDTLLNGAYTVDPDKLCYMDTDSIHFLGETPKELEPMIDSYKLGFWKHESEWSAGKFLRDKSYAEKIKGKLDIKCAGLSEEAKNNIKKFEDFELGRYYEGTIVKKMVPGGVLLTKVRKQLRE